MNDVEFIIAYDGPALAGHIMDVQDIGPALLAIGDLCREAHRVLNGPNSGEVTVRVKATSEGCFEITLLLQISEWIADLGLDESDEYVEAAKEIVGWLGLAGGGLLWFLKRKRGRKIVRQERIDRERSNVYNITVKGDNNPITIGSPVYQLSRDERVCAALSRTLSPLRSDGVDEFQVRQEGETVMSVSKSDVMAGYFDPEPQTAALVLRSPVFARGGQWQFFYGPQRISATLRDAEFIRRVFDEGERFGAGDLFIVQLRLAQSPYSNERIRNDYEIIKVLEVTPCPPLLNGFILIKDA